VAVPVAKRNGNASGVVAGAELTLGVTRFVAGAWCVLRSLRDGTGVGVGRGATDVAAGGVLRIARGLSECRVSPLAVHAAGRTAIASAAMISRRPVRPTLSGCHGGLSAGHAPWRYPVDAGARVLKSSQHATGRHLGRRCRAAV
jgi:hypothetical protein